ncbi:hypothetical protein M3J09_000977 [Ascochyta lentis]
MRTRSPRVLLVMNAIFTSAGKLGRRTSRSN